MDDGPSDIRLTGRVDDAADGGHACTFRRSDQERSTNLRCSLEWAIRFIKEFDGVYGGLVRGVLVPERIETQTEENLLATKAAADALGCRVRLHAAQGSFEYAWVRKRHGLTPLQYLDKIGFLGQTTLIPHAMYVPGYSAIHGRALWWRGLSCGRSRCVWTLAGL